MSSPNCKCQMHYLGIPGHWGPSLKMGLICLSYTTSLNSKSYVYHLQRQHVFHSLLLRSQQLSICNLISIYSSTKYCITLKFRMMISGIIFCCNFFLLFNMWTIFEAANHHIEIHKAILPQYLESHTNVFF